MTSIPAKCDILPYSKQPNDALALYFPKRVHSTQHHHHCHPFRNFHSILHQFSVPETLYLAPNKINNNKKNVYILEVRFRWNKSTAIVVLTNTVMFSHSFSKGALIFLLAFRPGKVQRMNNFFSKKSTNLMYEVSIERVQIEVDIHV